MRLAEFIVHSKKEIIAQSLTYAKNIPALKNAPESVLSDHLPVVLETIRRDLEQTQSRAESIQKSRGNGPSLPGETAAQFHGTQRARSGLNIEQLIAEYRVLRSCVLRLWADAYPPDRHVIDDTLRFNEAMDQAIAESVAFYTAEVTRWRDIFIGVLGHDLRDPLHGVLLAAQMLKDKSTGDTAPLAASMLRGTRRLASLLDSLLDYNKVSLGQGLGIHRTEANLASECDEEIGLLRLTFPGRTITFTSSGDAHGSFDGSRIREALCNLVSNAAQYSPSGTDIAIVVTGTDRAVEISTANVSEPISPIEINALFDPLRRRIDSQRSNTNLGLGLFIVREIARAHHGQVTAAMDNGCIHFKMVLPKNVTDPQD